MLVAMTVGTSYSSYSDCTKELVLEMKRHERRHAKYFFLTIFSVNSKLHSAKMRSKVGKKLDWDK